MSETADRMDRDELKDLRMQVARFETALRDIKERVQVAGDHQSYIWNIAKSALSAPTGSFV